MPKKYSLNVDENDEVVSVEVDGVTYASPDDIPDPDDRHAVLMMMPFSGSLAAPQASGVGIEKVIAGVFFAVAAVTLSVAAVSAYYVRDELARERSAPGRVSDLVVKRDSDGDELSYPVVEFTLPDGTRKAVEVPGGTKPPAYAKGQAVTVKYDPDDPSDARIDSTVGTLLQWIVPAITGTIGVAFLIVTLFLVRSFFGGASPSEA